MNNLKDITINKISEKKSGWIFILVGLIFLIIGIPIIMYGAIKASCNGIMYFGTSRKNIRRQTKNSKLELKIENKELKEKNKELKTLAK